MDLILIGLVALGASLLTLFSGFGLGTILLPVFAIFFPLPLAIASTAIVHFTNNLFKLVLLASRARWNIVLKFGLPAMAAAFIGAQTLNFFEKQHLLSRVVGGLLIVLAILELIPAFKKLSFPSRWLPLGGILSGFLGGLSGQQGALRSAFLVRQNLEPAVFVATGVVIAVGVDLMRLAVYQKHLSGSAFTSSAVIVATLCAFAGAYLGSRWVKKLTLSSVQNLVALMLIGMGTLMIFNIL